MSYYRRYFINNNPIFITMVTYNRADILIDNIELLRKAFEISKNIINLKLLLLL